MPQPKVLVVDDSQFLRMHLARILQENGYEVILAEDGEKALELYSADRPDVVLLDITMPRLNGMDALIRLHQIDAGARVIMLTALDQKFLAAQAMRMGAREFLVKPVQDNKLLVAVKRVLGQGS